MKKIQEIDLNMAVSARLDDPSIEWFDVRQEPFSIHGLWNPLGDGPFRRLPADVAEATSEGVAALALNTSGGRVRFMTDSPFIAIHTEMSAVCHMDHMPFTGIFGFDLYAEENGLERYRGTFRPSVDMRGGYESMISLSGEGIRPITIHFPLYNGVDRLLVGVRRDSFVTAPKPYRHPLPVVFYGSSITQGGCASRPGNSYQGFISRMLGCDYINLGFSGSARGEEVLVRHMAQLPMSVFVCDYDHNAPTHEHLRATHEPLYRILREARPDLPILLISRPDVYLHEAEAEVRRGIILDTYNRALAEGDKNIAFIDGAEFFTGVFGTDCTVDGCHPTDLGFMRMAERIAPEILRFL